jgi:hypothetical protein
VGLGGGYDRAWLKPASPDGNTTGDSEDFDNVLGCHTGPHAGLNVFNPQAGWVYVHERNTPVDQMAARAKGGIPVQGDDPEYLQLRNMHQDGPQPIDTSQIYNDCILFKYPEERIREIREQEQRRAQAMMRNGSDDFMGRVTAAEQEMDPRGRGTRFAFSDHRMDFKDEKTGDTWDEWTPDQGIINRR